MQVGDSVVGSAGGLRALTGRVDPASTQGVETGLPGG